MKKETLIVKLLDLAEGRETPESWRNWWDEHEPELEVLLKRGEFLKLKPCKHGFKWVVMLTSQKGAISILNNHGIEFKINQIYHERYLEELDNFCKEQKKIQQRKQKEFKDKHQELYMHYPKFSKALSNVLEPSDIIKSPATESQIYDYERFLGIDFPIKIKEFFLLTMGINISVGVVIELSDMFTLSIDGKKYCVLGEFWKEADGDQLLIQSGDEIIYYYAHEQNKVKKLCNDFNELLEKKISSYIRNN